MTILLFSGAMGGGPATTFDLPLTDSGAGAVNKTPTSSSGSGAATFTRATTAFTTLSTGVLAQVSSGVARSNYSPTGAYLGYLAEGQRTNLCLQSQTLDSATWAKTQCTVTADAVVAPDGTTTMDKIVESAATATHFIQQMLTLVNATAYVYSFYIKAAERTWVQFGVGKGGGTGGDDALSYVNLATGAIGTTVGTGVTVTTQDIGNGVYRCFAAFTSNGVTGKLYVAPAAGDGAVNYAGNGTSGIYAWGGQIEAGAFASTYIPTVAASVTRNADVLTYATTGNISDTAGGAYAEITETSYANAAGTIIGDGTNGPLVPSSANSGFVFKDGTSTVNGPTGAPSGTIKGASSWSGSASQVAVGGTAGTAGSYDGAFGLATIGIGTSGYGSIKNVKIYGSALTAAQLQALTA